MLWLGIHNKLYKDFIIDKQELGQVASVQYNMLVFDIPDTLQSQTTLTTKEILEAVQNQLSLGSHRMIDGEAL